MKALRVAGAVAAVMVTATTFGTGIALAAPSQGTAAKGKEVATCRAPRAGSRRRRRRLSGCLLGR